MVTNTSTNNMGSTNNMDKKDEAQAEAKKAGDAAKSAGKKASEAAGDEMHNLKADLDDLISRIPGLSDVDLEEAKEKLMAKIASTKDAAKGMAGDAREQIHHGIECSEEYVKGHPMQSVGYAALAGFLLGLLMTRR